MSISLYNIDMVNYNYLNEWRYYEIIKRYNSKL